MQWSEILTWGSIAVMLTAGMSNFYFAWQTSKRISYYNDLIRSQAEAVGKWQGKRNKWIAIQRERLFLLRDSENKRRYLAELNELQESLESVSSKKISPDRAVELPG